MRLLLLDRHTVVGARADVAVRVVASGVGGVTVGAATISVEQEVAMSVDHTSPSERMSVVVADSTLNGVTGANPHLSGRFSFSVSYAARGER